MKNQLKGGYGLTNVLDNCANLRYLRVINVTEKFQCEVQVIRWDPFNAVSRLFKRFDIFVAA